MLCVEANPTLVKIIESNFNLNEFVNFRIYNVAITEDKTENTYFNAGEDNTTGFISTNKNANSILIESKSLSEIVSISGFDNYSLVCDIEGAETNFILSDKGALERCAFIVIELHDFIFEGSKIEPNQLKVELVNLGFEIVEEYGNVIAAKKEKF